MSRTACSVAITVVLLAVNFVVWGLAETFGREIAKENAALENFEVVFLVFGMVVFGVCARQVTKKADRLFFYCLSLFYLTFWVREVELGGLIDSVPLLIIFEAPYKYFWLGGLWAAAVFLFACNSKAVLRVFFDWVWSLPGRLILAAGALYGLSDAFDKNLFGFDRVARSFYEEVLEVNATALMLLSALATYFLITSAIKLQVGEGLSVFQLQEHGNAQHHADPRRSPGR